MILKKCDMCHQEVLIELFGRNRSRKDGLHTTCKPCRKIIDKKYSENNKSKIKIIKHEYYLKNKEYIVEKNTDYIKNNREKHNLWHVNSRIKLKTEVFFHYSGGEIKCKNCEEKQLEVLTIDHINGNGNKHRKEQGIKTGYSTYQWLKKNNFPVEFQVLCFNCQYVKRRLEMGPKIPTKLQFKTISYNLKIKLECLDHYGKVCPCGVIDPIVLSLDHVNDDGKKHRTEVNAVGNGFYHYLRRNGFPNDPPLQVLCMSCQYRKRYENERKNRSTIDSDDSAILI